MDLAGAPESSSWILSLVPEKSPGAPKIHGDTAGVMKWGPIFFWGGADQT